MNTSLVTSITCAALIFIGGCASAPSQMPFTDLRKGESEVGASARAYVGDVVYRKFDIKEQFEGFVSGQAKIAGFTVNFADTKVQRMLIDGQDGGITRDQLTGSTFLYPALPVAPIGLIDSDSDGVFEKYWYPGSGEGKLKTPIFVDWVQSNRSKGYRRELIYQGRDGDNLKLFYREFIDDFKRSAYDQEVQYDLSKSTNVQFKGLTIQVEEANNEYLIYTIEGGSL
mgnify:CR=1 FL=1|jgi:hypothetical protein|tara:strand:- start:1072 stop:1752 length:681 start_codon:yes stop_codon:yes gene_type:complete